MVAGIRRTDRYYGWTITWTLALTETVSWGILFYAFSALLVPMQEEFGWSATAITGAYSLSMLVAGLAAPFVGRWLDRRGARGLMTAGSILGTALVFTWSRIDTLPGFYLLWIGIGLATAATLYEPAFTVLTQWFDRGRGKAMLIVTIAGGFASTIFLPLTGWLEQRYDWRTALVFLAVILGVTTIPSHGLLLRGKPEDLAIPIDGDDPEQQTGEGRAPAKRSVRPAVAIHSAGFRWMSIAFFLQTLASIAIGVHMIAFLIERGDGATFAAAATGLIGAAQVAARIVTTLLERRVPLVTLTAIVFLLQAAAFVLLLIWVSPAGVIASVILLGMGRGAITLIRPGLLADLYGRQHFGTINGAQTMIVAAARALAPVATGAAYTLADGYPPVIWGLAGITILSAAAMMKVPSHAPS